MRGAARKRWQQRANEAGSRSTKRVPFDPRPIVVSPRYARFLDEQRERLKADALARMGKTSGHADAAGS
jgi:hypothetical protein